MTHVGESMVTMNTESLSNPSRARSPKALAAKNIRAAASMPTHSQAHYSTWQNIELKPHIDKASPSDDSPAPMRPRLVGDECLKAHVATT